MVKSHRPPRASAEDHVRELLDDPEADGHDEVVAMTDFWGRIRPLIATNDASVGLEALDDLALSVMAGHGAPPLGLASPVLLLPPPDLMFAGQAAPSSVFDGEAAASPPKHPAPRTRGKSRRSPPAKKQKLSKEKARAADLALYSLELPDDTPGRVKKDVARILREAARLKLPPYRLAFPWAGLRAWYDPAKHPDLYLAHYRFFMRYRETFFLCALYPPSDDAEYRRKQKANAIAARLVFLAKNILTFGYYGFLEALETLSHDTLMWMGGKPSKHSVSAKTQPPDAAPAEDLVSLLKRDPARYQRTVERVLDPTQVDEDGFSSVPELLEQTGALDRKKKAKFRLCDEALARIAYDVSGGPPARASWVGNTGNGVWKQLLASKELRAIQEKLHKKWDKGTYRPPTEEKRFSPSEVCTDDSDYEDESGNPTVLPPEQPFRRLYKSRSTVPQHTGLTDDEDEDMGDDEEEKPKPPRKTLKTTNSESDEDQEGSDRDGDPDESEADQSGGPSEDEEAGAETEPSKPKPKPKKAVVSKSSSASPSKMGSKSPSPEKSK